MDRDELDIRIEIDALCAEFWYRVDHHDGEGVADLFTPDGVYSAAGGANAGREAIAESYVLRKARGPRLSRHTHSNLRLTIESPTRATGMSMLTLWADDGVAPMDIGPPVSVSDVHDTYEKGDDGVWRIKHRHLTAAFVGPKPGVLPFRPIDSEADGG